MRDLSTEAANRLASLLSDMEEQLPTLATGQLIDFLQPEDQSLLHHLPSYFPLQGSTNQIPVRPEPLKSDAARFSVDLNVGTIMVAYPQ